MLFDTGTMRAGLSRFTKDADQQPPDWALPATEVLLVLEGEARVEIEDGPVLELKAEHGLPAKGGGDDLASHPSVQGDVGARQVTGGPSISTLAQGFRLRVKAGAGS